MFVHDMLVRRRANSWTETKVFSHLTILPHELFILSFERGNVLHSYQNRYINIS